MFKPRRTELAPVVWEERHHAQQELYEAVTEYVREGYNIALKEKRSYIGFLVKLLLDAATRCEETSTDAKAEALLDWIYRLHAEETDSNLKVLVFTEFVPTQKMLQKFLSDRDFNVVCLNGSMDMEERKRVQDAFLWRPVF